MIQQVLKWCATFAVYALISPPTLNIARLERMLITLFVRKIKRKFGLKPMA